LLAGGQAGWLLPGLSSATLCDAITEVLSRPDTVAAKVAKGYEKIQQDYDLPANAQRLAHWLTCSRRTSQPIAPRNADRPDR
jgi:hypothetical protein